MAEATPAWGRSNTMACIWRVSAQEPKPVGSGRGGGLKPVCQLHNVESEVVHSQNPFPTLRQSFLLQKIAVGRLAGGFAIFALIPNGALHGKRREGIDHAVEQAERAPGQDRLAVEWRQHGDIRQPFGRQPGIDARAADG